MNNKTNTSQAISQKSDDNSLNEHLISFYIDQIHYCFSVDSNCKIDFDYIKENALIQIENQYKPIGKVSLESVTINPSSDDFEIFNFS